MATYRDDCVKSYKLSAVTKNPYFKLEFDWDIENKYYTGLSPIILSPEILLPGITWQFGLRNKPDTRGYEFFINSSCKHPLSIWGMCYYGEKEFGVTQDILIGDNTISQGRTLFFVDVLLKFSADLKVYGFNIKSFFLNENPNQNQTNYLVPLNSNDEFLYVKNSFDKIRAMWQSKTTDTQIQVEEKTIHVHKFILLTMSPVLASMLQKPTEENSQEIIPIPDTSFEAMESVVKFMYGIFPDEEALDWDKLCELYSASDKFQVLDLRDICGRAMIKKLTIENVCQLLDISDRYKDDDFMKQVVAFCRKNFKEVSETEGWKNWIAKNRMFTALLRCFADTSE